MGEAQTHDDNRVRVTAADFNGREWDGSPFDHAPPWLHAAFDKGEISLSGAHCTDYAVWSVAGGEAFPGDFIVLNADGTLSIQKAERP